MAQMQRWGPVALALSFFIGTPVGPAIAADERQITDGKKVLMEFTIVVPEENTVFPNNVAQYVQGRHEVLPALEQALTGMTPGEKKRIDLPADQAFGPYDEKKKVTISRDQLPADLKPGAVLRNPEGQPFTVVELSDANAVVDYNHPLAGKHLVFDVKIIDVQQQP